MKDTVITKAEAKAGDAWVKEHFVFIVIMKKG